jgi:lipoprotein NlpI
MKLTATFLCLTLASPLVARQAQTQRPQEVFDRAVTDFEQGRVAESAAGFDTVARLVPELAPQLWQRGIALYYAGRYKDCREQFESHRKVNPNDVENAAWHFLCVARQESATQARNVMLPVGPDSRVPMRQIDEMFRGRRTPAEVLAAAGNQASGQFYAELYVGLYYEAVGNQPLALQHITNAAAPRFAAAGGYMHMVARIHLGILQKQK